MRRAWTLLRDTFKAWNADKVPRLAAALAYYTVFSLAPLLIITIAIAGLVLGQAAVQGQLYSQLDTWIGKDGSELIQTMIASTQGTNSGLIATIVGTLTLVLGAIGVFGQLQEAFNAIWHVPETTGTGWRGQLQERFSSLLMVLALGAFLLLSLLTSAILAALNTWAEGLLPGAPWLWDVLHQVISLLILIGLFAAMFKKVPDVSIKWSDVWPGAILTAILFTIGRSLIDLYLSFSAVASAYGAAGALIVILVWIYYSTLIVLFGAEFTRVYTEQIGSRAHVAAAQPAQQPTDGTTAARTGT